MTLGLFTDDFYPYIGGMGRFVYELTRRIPESRLIIFSPCSNEMPNHIQVSPSLHQQLRNLSYSYWLHRNLEKLIGQYSLTRINIQCGPGGIFLLKRAGIPVIATCYHTWWQQSHYIGSQFWKKCFVPFERRSPMPSRYAIRSSNDNKEAASPNFPLICFGKADA